ncbi:MAG: threonine synthase [Rhizobiales bacterium]|nr:threonine synthase [Hyphomicrobiales bacterium]
MKYVSTRGRAPVLDFEDALLTGLARDGGLYVPETWPTLSHDQLRDLRGKPYADVAMAVIRPFVSDSLASGQLRTMIDEAYATFGHPAVTPLKQLDANQWLLELFHGPTLAFKDIAMQLLSRLMDWALERREARATIVGATSGDTGGAAIDAFQSSKRTSIFILHPNGRVSDVQRRQMTTVMSDNVHNIALNGTFDDCQAALKDMFNDMAFRDEVHLAGVNSINWARIMAQIVYYVTAAVALGAPDRQVSFTVPTGNFGDIFAGYVAKQMGVPIDRLVIATNVNDILERTLRTGRYEVTGVTPTTSPSMDIQVSSNFERLLFEAHGRDSQTIVRLMSGLKQSDSFGLAQAPLAAIRASFDAGRCSEQEVAQTIAETLAATGELLDPHSAVGYAVAKRMPQGASPMVILATAHPAKFPQAVEGASGIHPALPARLGDLMSRQERFVELDNDLTVIESHIRQLV